MYKGSNIQDHGGSAVRVNAGGDFTLHEGTITSCDSGVRVYPNGAFAMYDGTIASCGGWGVYTSGSSTMYDGTIASCGGGVVVGSGNFTMKNGTITGNTSSRGGGVSVESGTFVMDGGSISDNSSSEHGGGVRLFATGAFTMNGGEITGNHAASSAGGVYGNFNIAGGRISGNTSDNPDPLYKNINSVPVALGEDFVIEAYHEVTGVGSITLRDINGYVKTRVTGGNTYACSALVLGVGGPPQDVTWSLGGHISDSTSINPQTGALAVGYDETAETLWITAVSAQQPDIYLTLELPVDLYVERRLKAKLDITATGKAGVTEVFTALHDYIAAGHLSDANEKGIAVGDYVDLYSLRVSDTVTPGYTAGTFNTMNAVLPNEHGTTLRLIIAGVNSYKGLNGNTEDHVVFQFLNIPLARRRLNELENVTGYAESEIRKYLSPVAGFENSGCFYAGLLDAGIPEEAFYRPRRALAGASGADYLEDPVWLPAAREMNAFSVNEAAGQPPPPVQDTESAENQPVFPYYTAGRVSKYSAANTTATYWTGSFSTGNGFIAFFQPYSGAPYFRDFAAMSYEYGLVPAFCVR
jgi:hypothetical protein